MMTTKDSEATPVRSNAHDSLSVFLGKWRILLDSSRVKAIDPRGAQFG